MTSKLNLDVAKADEVPGVLRRAAQNYLDSANELQSAWQSKTAGRVWNRLAHELERAALRAEQILNQEGWR
jgi:hypothetical protein